MRLARALKSVGDILPLLRREAIGRAAVAPPAFFIVGRSDELDRGEADKDRPQDRHPATGEKRAEANAEEHGARIRGRG